MSVKISGWETQLVKQVQKKLDNFETSGNACQEKLKELNELSAKTVELADMPAHEAHYQTVLDEYKKAVEMLKADAEKMRKATDESHIHKYFRYRRLEKINRLLNAGPKDGTYINIAYKDYLIAVHDKAKKITQNDFEKSINEARGESNRRKAEALASIEYSKIDQTFPSIREKLLNENPSEYLRQSDLYQYKLIENKDEAGFFAFGMSWIKNLPKEATWQQVEHMSLRMVELAKINPNIDLTEYRSAVKEWLNEHPLPENSGDPTPDPARSPSGRLTHVLGMLYISNNRPLDLSDEAYKIYQRCSVLSPEQEVWKIAKDEAFSSIEYSSIDQTFPSSREKLLKENPSEYLRQSDLYQCKLWEKKDEAGLFAFGMSWIKNLPKEATWQQVEHMSFLMIELAKTNEKIDLTEYRGAVQQWLNEHPLPENSGDPTPDPATSPSGRLTYVLGMLYICNNQPLDLSNEAFQIYQRCSVLSPEQEVWKVAKDKAFASIEYSNIDQTFPSSREKLLKENPSEYLRQATLYLRKLWENKDEKGALAFGTVWMQTLPKEASLEQVEGMTLRMLNTTQSPEDLKGFRAAFEGWLRDRLLKENPVEYLRLSNLYHQELLQNNDEKSALAFGASWMQTLPKEASWEHINRMTIRMLNTTQNREDLKEYRTAFEAWLGEHPLSESPDPASITPELASTPWGQKTYLLGVFHAEDPIETLNPETRQLYRNCSALHPEITHWKVQLALYHTLKKEWVEAKRLLAGLSPEDAGVKSAQKTLTDDLKERSASAAIDIGLTALNQIIPASYRELAPVDFGFTAANLVLSNPVRGTWLPHVLGNPERAMPLRRLISLSLITIGADIVDYIFRNIHALNRFHQAESRVSNVVRMGYTGWEMYNYTALRTWSAAPNLAGLALSSGQTVADWLDIRRPPAVQAMLSTVQSTSAGIGAVCFIASYSDLAPPAWSHVKQLTGVSKSSSPAPTVLKTSESSDKQWMFIAAGIGIVAIYHLYSHYPYTWAAAVMNDAMKEHSKGKYEDAKRVIADSEKTYFVARTRPDVREFAKYLDSLQIYQTFPEDGEKHTKLQAHFFLILGVLKKSDHYRGVRLSLLMKKAEIALQKHDAAGLAEAIKEDFKSKIAECSFQNLLSSAYHFAMKNPAAARAYLTKMSPAFPHNFNPKTEALDKLLEKHAQPLLEWAEQNFIALINNPPSPQNAEAWDKAFQDLQAFFSKNIGKTAVYQDLQYSRLILSISQSNHDQTEALFAASGKEVHLRFAQELIQHVAVFRKNRRYLEAFDLIKRIRFNSFKHNQLIQDYGHFFILAFISTPSKNLEQLDRCIDALEPNNKLHQELRVFFNAVRVVATLDTGECGRARELLAQEKEVSAEVAAILFEKVNAVLQEKGKEQALADLQAWENLGPWEHAQLFNTFEIYLSSETPLEEHAAAVIAHLQPFENLSHFVSDLKLHRFALCLFQKKYETAKSLLNEPMSTEFKSKLKKKLSQSLISIGQDLRGKKSLREARKTLQHLKTYFSLPNSDAAGHYVNFLVLLENLQNNPDLQGHLKTIQALSGVLDKFDEPSLRGEKVEILRTIAHLALREGQKQVALQALNIALTDLELLKKTGMDVDGLERFIRGFQEQLIK